MKELLLVLLLVATGGAAGQVYEPSELTKKQILLEAYRSNGNSMTRWGAMDMTNPDVTFYENDEIVCGWVKGEATGSMHYECKDYVLPMRVGKPAKAAGDSPPAVAPEKAKDMAAAPHQESNVCKRHGLRKVWSRGGSRWNCRR